jgi:putative FmdB family regulatory protein
MPLYDFKCADHGYYEAFNKMDAPGVPCPECGVPMSIVHLQPIAIKSDSTKRTDMLHDMVAQQHGLSDIYKTYEGETQADAQAAHAPKLPDLPDEVMQRLTPRWATEAEKNSVPAGRSQEFAQKVDENGNVVKSGSIPPPVPHIMGHDHQHKAPV